LQDVPLFGQLMLSGSQGATTERAWLLRLLLAGLRDGSSDARLYRRRYVLELAMALYDSAGAHGGARVLLLCVPAVRPLQQLRAPQQSERGQLMP
jgi:hypothetical protein